MDVFKIAVMWPNGAIRGILISVLVNGDAQIFYWVPERIFSFICSVIVPWRKDDEMRRL